MNNTNPGDDPRTIHDVHYKDQEYVKEYDAVYMEILERKGTASKRQINKIIAKKWNIGYDQVKRIGRISESIFIDHDTSSR